MPSKIKVEPRSQTSPVLFLTAEGEPMFFFLRPGPVKRELQPLIKAGGGMLCNVQKPGAILLMDPEDTASISKTTAHWYVSTKYIHDCFEKNERLKIEDYRLNPEPTQTKTKTKTKSNNSKVGSPSLSGGRAAYTPEEDDAILSYVSMNMNEVGGNRLWQEMENQQVTSHSWQSMKYRYRARLVHKLSEYKQTDTAQAEKEDEMQRTDPAEAQSNEESQSPQRISVETEDHENNSAEEDLTQIHPCSNSQDEPTDVQQAKCPDSGTCDSMETSNSEVDETPEQEQPTQLQARTTISSEKDGLSESTTAVKPQLTNSKDKPSPKSVHRPLTRQQVELENMPYVKRLRSSSASPESLFKSPQLLSKTKTHTSHIKEQRSGESPPKKARRKTGEAVAEQEQEESEQRAPSVITQPDEANCPAPQQTEKRPEKRKLGILELATKEFEDDSEPESPDPQAQDETAPGPSTSTDPVVAASNTADQTPSASNDQQAPSPIQADQDLQPTTTTTTAAAAPSTSTSDPAVPEPATRDQPPPSEEGTSKAHLFIFDSESQEVEEEEESQSLVGGHTSDPVQPQTNGHKDAPLSLTQDQLEEDIQLIKEFMSQTNQDLVSVTKALLKTSGHFAAARDLLLNPSSATGPVWTRTDDQRLCSADPEVRQELLTKYGEEGVAKRLMFLELEG